MPLLGGWEGQGGPEYSTACAWSPQGEKLLDRGSSDPAGDCFETCTLGCASLDGDLAAANGPSVELIRAG